jgi:hypothetical protein
MDLTVDLYLADRIVRGILSSPYTRVLDMFNNLGSVVMVREAGSMSLHQTTQPLRLGTTRIEKERILLVAPRAEPDRAEKPEAWVPKKRSHAIAGVGPLVVLGDFYLDGDVDTSSISLLVGTDARPFIPVTSATVSTEYHPDWHVELPIVFLRRRAVDFVALPTAPEPPKYPNRDPASTRA